MEFMKTIYSPSGWRTILLCCNIALLFVGVTVLTLGVKMQSALFALLLDDMPLIPDAVRCIIAAGILISVTASFGIGGAFYEIAKLLLMHLGSLAIVVIMQFALGVTLFIMKQTVEDVIESDRCNMNCARTLDSVVLNYALPSAGLIMTVIIVEGLMIYCAILLYLHVKDTPRNIPQIQEPRASFIVSGTRSNAQNTSPRTPRTCTPSYNRSFDYNNHSSLLSPYASLYCQDPPSYDDAMSNSSRISSSTRVISRDPCTPARSQFMSHTPTAQVCQVLNPGTTPQSGHAMNQTTPQANVTPREPAPPYTPHASPFINHAPHVGFNSNTTPQIGQVLDHTTPHGNQLVNNATTPHVGQVINYAAPQVVNYEVVSQATNPQVGQSANHSQVSQVLVSQAMNQSSKSLTDSGHMGSNSAVQAISGPGTEIQISSAANTSRMGSWYPA